MGSAKNLFENDRKWFAGMSYCKPQSGYSHICCAKWAIWNVLVPSQASPIDKVASVQFIFQINIFWNIGHAVQVLVCRVAKEWHVHLLQIWFTIDIFVQSYPLIRSKKETLNGLASWHLIHWILNFYRIEDCLGILFYAHEQKFINFVVLLPPYCCNRLQSWPI